jgi:dCTP deaminase
MTVLVDKQIKKLVVDHKLISPFFDDALEGASYDMRAGPQYQKNGKIMQLTSTDRSILIEPGEFVLLTTFEKLNLPLDIVGHNGIMSPWAKRGLVSLFSPQIDPGFKGVLVVPVYNSGDSEITIQLEEKIFTVEFTLTSMPSSFGWSDKKNMIQTGIISQIPIPNNSRPLIAESTSLRDDIQSLKMRTQELAKDIDRIDKLFGTRISLKANTLAIIAIIVSAIALLPEGTVKRFLSYAFTSDKVSHSSENITSDPTNTSHQ